MLKLTLLVFLLFCLSGCVSGHLEYIDTEGNRKTGCEVEFLWEPVGGEHAVDYVLNYCAQRYAKKDYALVDDRVLKLDIVLPDPPPGKEWSYNLASQMLKEDQLTDKEYGYLIAHVELNYQKAVTRLEKDLEGGLITKQQFNKREKAALDKYYGH